MSYVPNKVLDDLQKKKYAPVYFFQGDEPYYIELLTNYIEKHVLTPTEQSFNQLILYGKECSMVDVLTRARRFTMMSVNQVVIVKEAQEMQDLKNEEGQQLLMRYIENPQPTTLLVFAYKHKVIDTRKPFGALLARKVVLVNSNKLYENQVTTWIVHFVTQQGLSITEKAVEMLYAFIGNDLLRIAKEVDKISANLVHNKIIDDVIVQQYVGINRFFNSFELKRALMKKDYTKVCQIVFYFAADRKNNLLPVLTLLFALFSKLLLIYQLKERSPQHVAKVVQINPYFLSEYLEAMQHYGFQKVMDNIQYLHQADLQLKGIGYPSIEEGQIFKELIFKLMHS